jgi:hypothetical protein
MLEGEAKAMSTLSSLEGEGSLMVLSILSTEEGLFKAHPTLRAKAAMKGVVVHPVAQLGESVGAREVQVEGVAEAATIKVHLIVLLISTLPVHSILLPNRTGVKGLRSITKCNLRATDRHLQCMEGLRDLLSHQCLRVHGLYNQEDGALHILVLPMDLVEVLLCKFLRPLQVMGLVLV